MRGKNVMVAVVLSAKAAPVRHMVDGRWNVAEAANTCQNVAAFALRKAHPSHRAFLILEDNDPAGYKAKLSVDTKVREKINCLPFPKRSPDLNPLDYGFWSMINRRLRKQEAKFPAGEKESRVAFIKRLRSTVKRVSSTTLEPLVKPMKRRCSALLDA